MVAHLYTQRAFFILCTVTANQNTDNQSTQICVRKTTQADYNTQY